MKAAMICTQIVTTNNPTTSHWALETHVVPLQASHNEKFKTKHIQSCE